MDENIKENLLLQADEFEEAYKRCARGENPHKDETGRIVYHAVNLPAVVNAAFSCELYLKYLIGSKCSGHDLEQLFRHLDPNFRMKLEMKSAVRFKITSFALMNFLREPKTFSRNGGTFMKNRILIRI